MHFLSNEHKKVINNFTRTQTKNLKTKQENLEVRQILIGQQLTQIQISRRLKL